MHCLTPQAFFGGVALCRVLDWFADALMAAIAKFSHRRRSHSTNSSSNDLCAVHIEDAAPVAEQQLCSMGPDVDLHEGAHLSHRKDPAHKSHVVVVREFEEGGSFNKDVLADGADAADVQPTVVRMSSPGDEHERVIAAAVEQLGEEDCGHLVRTSIMVWLALSLHNLPEGLATIVG
jgi:zinc transporter ZupT